MAVQDKEPWTIITEQPKSKAHRFRYECEGRSAGSIPGENSSVDKKTFPSIKINNYTGEAVVVISCLTKDTPPRPHPHSIVGTNCSKGVFTQKFVVNCDPISFPNLGIRCVKKKDIIEALRQREEIRVDPFRTGFSHPENSIDLNVVRLCFQVFLPGSQGKFNRIISPVLSQAIFDKKSAGELVINRLSRNTGSARGGDEIFLLCDKVSKDDIKVKFVLINDGDDTVLWEAFGEFGVPDVHHQYAIVFKTPPFRDKYLSEPVSVQIILQRPSDGEESDGRTFRYVPDDDDPEAIRDKKRKRIALTQDIPSVVDYTCEPSATMAAVKMKVRQSVTAKRRRNKGNATEEEDGISSVTSEEDAQPSDWLNTPDVSLLDPGAQLEQMMSGDLNMDFRDVSFAAAYTSFNSEELSAVAQFMLTNNGGAMMEVPTVSEIGEGTDIVFVPKS